VAIESQCSVLFLFLKHEDGCAIIDQGDSADKPLLNASDRVELCVYYYPSFPCSLYTVVLTEGRLRGAREVAWGAVLWKAVPGRGGVCLGLPVHVSVLVRVM
jgi:hypothetical protein